MEVDLVTHDEKEKANVAKDIEDDSTPTVDKGSLVDTQDDDSNNYDTANSKSSREGTQYH